LIPSTGDYTSWNSFQVGIPTICQYYSEIYSNIQATVTSLSAIEDETEREEYSSKLAENLVYYKGMSLALSNCPLISQYCSMVTGNCVDYPLTFQLQAYSSTDSGKYNVAESSSLLIAGENVTATTLYTIVYKFLIDFQKRFKHRYR
jgi:hypothetical protein